MGINFDLSSLFYELVVITAASKFKTRRKKAIPHPAAERLWNSLLWDMKAPNSLYKLKSRVDNLIEGNDCNLHNLLLSVSGSPQINSLEPGEQSKGKTKSASSFSAYARVC